MKIFVVTSGNNLGDANQHPRFYSFEYSQALRIARKLVRVTNKKMNQKDRNDFGVLVKISSDRIPTLGMAEKVMCRWSNKIRNVSIVMYRMEKEYSPEWIE